jgi:hypothetical protein
VQLNVWDRSPWVASGDVLYVELTIVSTTILYVLHIPHESVEVFFNQPDLRRLVGGVVVLLSEELVQLVVRIRCGPVTIFAMKAGNPSKAASV